MKRGIQNRFNMEARKRYLLALRRWLWGAGVSLLLSTSERSEDVGPTPRARGGALSRALGRAPAPRSSLRRGESRCYYSLISTLSLGLALTQEIKHSQWFATNECVWASNTNYCAVHQNKQNICECHHLLFVNVTRLLPADLTSNENRGNIGFWNGRQKWRTRLDKFWESFFSSQQKWFSSVVISIVTSRWRSRAAWGWTHTGLHNLETETYSNIWPLSVENAMSLSFNGCCV